MVVILGAGVFVLVTFCSSLLNWMRPPIALTIIFLLWWSCVMCNQNTHVECIDNWPLMVGYDFFNPPPPPKNIQLCTLKKIYEKDTNTTHIMYLCMDILVVGPYIFPLNNLLLVFTAQNTYMHMHACTYTYTYTHSLSHIHSFTHSHTYSPAIPPNSPYACLHHACCVTLKPSVIKSRMTRSIIEVIANSHDFCCCCLFLDTDLFLACHVIQPSLYAKTLTLAFS